MTTSMTWAQGNIHTLLPVTIQNGTGVAVTPVDLSTAQSIAISLQRTQIGAQVMPWVTCQGSATITNASAGQFNYAFAAADVAAPGVYNLVVRVTFTSGGSPWVSLPAEFVIEETQ